MTTSSPAREQRPEALSDRELERELTIAALRSHRSRRFERLLAERRRRRRQTV